MYGQQRVAMGPQLTPFTKQLLIGLAGLYVAQLLLENWLGVPVVRSLAWWSIHSPSFGAWQPITAFFVNTPGEPIWVVVQWIVLAFFIPPAEAALGRRGLLEAWAWAAVGGIGVTLALNFLGAVGGATPYLGLAAVLESLIVIFGLSRPNAQILIFFVLPVRASWVAWGSGLLTFLYFLSSRDLASSVSLFAWGATVAYMYRGRLRPHFVGRGGGGNKPRGSSRFNVIDGGRDDNGPVYH